MNLLHLPSLAVNRSIDARVWLLPLHTAACMSSFLLPAGKLRFFSVAPLVVNLIYEIPKYGSGAAAQDNLLGINTAVLILKFIDWTVLHCAEDDAWEVDEGDQDEGKGQPRNSVASATTTKDATVPEKVVRAPITRWEKLMWSVKLWTTNRGIGWNWKVKNVPRGVPPTYSKWYRSPPDMNSL